MGTTRYEVLGPLAVRWGGVPIELGPRQQQRILAALLLKANQAVHPRELVAAAWDTTPPPDAEQVVSDHVASLRDLLDPHRPPGVGELLITLASGAYVLCVEPGDSDLGQFSSEVEQARGLRSVGRHREAGDRLRTALSRWHGTPLAGLDGTVVDAERQRLLNERSAAREDLRAIELELAASPPSPQPPPTQTAAPSLGAVMIFKLIGLAVPIVTVGLAGWLVTAVLAIKRRSIPLALSAAGYLAMTLAFWIYVVTPDGPDLTTGRQVIGVVHIFATLACAFQAAVVIGRKQFDQATAHLVTDDVQR